MMNMRRITYRVITYMEDWVGKCRQVKNKNRKSCQSGVSVDFLAVSSLCGRHTICKIAVYIMSLITAYGLESEKSPGILYELENGHPVLGLICCN